VKLLEYLKKKFRNIWTWDTCIVLKANGKQLFVIQTKEKRITLKREIKINGHTVKRKHIVIAVVIVLFILSSILINIFLPSFLRAFIYIYSFSGIALMFMKWIVPRWNKWFEHMVL
jgi:hypothetical protein